MRILICLLAPAVIGLSSCEKLKLGAGAAAAPSRVARELRPSDFDSFIATPGRLVVVDFHADWCGPCQQLGPVLEKVAGDYENEVVLGKVNVDEARDLAGRLGVSSIPDVRLFRDGVMVDRFVGAIPEEQFRERVRRHTFGLGAQSATPTTDENAQPEPAVRPMEKDWLPPGIERR